MGDAMNQALIAKRLDELCRTKVITPATERVGRMLLWKCPPNDHGDSQTSYTRLARLAGVARSTAIAAVKQLRTLGVLTWRRTRLHVAWAFGVASRQWRNVYTWILLHTESDRRSTNSEKANPERRERARWDRPAPHSPVRSVAEQLRALGFGP
jgi:hypothetical protein